MRERGLKSQSEGIMFGEVMSLPLRERGLKFDKNKQFYILFDVAPLAGAWIEIFFDGFGKASELGRSPCGSVD